MDLPARYVVMIWCVFGYVVTFIMRINLSVAIVAMIKNRPINGTEEENNSTPPVCPELYRKLERNSSSWNLEPRGELNWDRETQSHVLGAVFYGIILSRLPGGILSDKWSAKWTSGLATLLGSLLTLLSPVASRWSVNAFIALRVVIGVTQGVILPSFNTMVGRWAPKMERSWMSSVVNSGTSIGSVIGLTLSGFLCTSNLWGGWPSAFYVSSIIGFMWCISWFFLIYDKPERHPRISQSELLYITENKIAKQAKLKIPWIPILTSVRLWALVVAHFGHTWCFYTIFYLMPIYLANVLHFSIEKNGVLSSLPHILFVLTTCLAGYLADKMRQKGKFSITTIRKIFNSVAFFGSGLFILLVTFVGCRPAASITFLCMSLGFIGANASAFRVTHVDMSPQFAGVLSGIIGTIGCCTGFLVPYTAGKLTASGETLFNWGKVFGTTAGIAFGSGLVYDVFSSSELQAWNPPLEDMIPKENVELQNNAEGKKLSTSDRKIS